MIFWKILPFGKLRHFCYLCGLLKNTHKIINKLHKNDLQKAKRMLVNRQIVNCNSNRYV